MNQEQIKDEKSSIFTLLVSSILLHILLILAIIFYRLNPDVSFQIPKKISQDDHVVLWTNPVPKTSTPQPIAKAKEEPKQPNINPFKETPIITPGSQGIDEQHTSGAHNQQQTKTITKKDTIEEKTEQNNTNYDTKTKEELRTENSFTSELINPHASQTTKSEKKIGENKEKSNKQPLKFDTNLKMFPNAKRAENQNVPEATKKNSVKSISFKDIGLGFNNAGTNIGNSRHLMIQGTSPDIPEGDELKYITFINQMANMIVASIHSNPRINSAPRRTDEKIICFMKINRSGQLLGTKIITPSKHEIINAIIIDSIHNVGLFNPIPKFIEKDTFEINWHILT